METTLRTIMNDSLLFNNNRTASFRTSWTVMRAQKISRAQGFHRPSEIHPVDIYQTNSAYHQWLHSQLGFFGIPYDPYISVFQLELLYMQQFTDIPPGLFAM